MTEDPKSKGEAWLEGAGRIMLEVEKVALRCAPEFRQVAFEVLLQRALAQQSSVEARSGPSGTFGASGSVVGASPGAPIRTFADFLKTHKLTTEQVATVVDFSTGHIIARDVGGSVATKQRNLAALVALWHAWTGGEFDIPYDDLASQCKEFGAEDTANMSSNLRRTEFAGSKVFISTDKGWKVTTPGQQFVGSLVRSLVGLPETLGG